MKIVDANEIPQEGVSHNPEIRKQVLIPNGQVTNLTNFSRSFFAPGQSTKSHAHSDMYEIFFVTQGMGVIEINGVGYRLEPGVCVTVEPGDEHVLKNLGEDELHLTYFGVLA